MDQLIEDLRSIAGPDIQPTESARAAARERLLREVDQQPRPAGRSRKRVLLTALVAASLIAVTMVMPVADRNSISRSNPSNHTALGALFASAAVASESQTESAHVYNYWYRLTRNERFWEDDGSKYGAWTGESTVEMSALWLGSDGSSKVNDRPALKVGDIGSEGPYTPDHQQQSIDEWNSMVNLPSSLDTLREYVQAQARSDFNSLEGDVSTVDQRSYELTSQALSVIGKLQRGPITPAVRTNLYLILGELADQAALVDKGQMTDATGRLGHGFSIASTDGPGGMIFVIDPLTGKFLESQEFHDGKLFGRDTQIVAGFVSSDTEVPAS